MTAISIGITTRNRPASLAACLQSIARVLGPAHDVMVFDDESDVPVSEQLDGVEGLPPVRILRDGTRRNYIVGRNQLVQQAQHDVVLLLDDDTRLLESAGLGRAVVVLACDPQVGAVAFAQAEPDGRPWPEDMQPGRGQAPCRVTAFIGFAHLVRRSTFLAVGGYQEHLVFHGEEKEYCLRLLAAGYAVVYLPGALIAHVSDPSGRDVRRYVRHVIRNDCLCAFYNDPWPLAAAGLPVRFLRYRRMASGIPGGDPGGFRWLLRELWESRQSVRAARRPLMWAQVREWRRLKRCPPYVSPPEAGHG
jgi:GT2 family glycosyltransferase